MEGLRRVSSAPETFPRWDYWENLPDNSQTVPISSENEMPDTDEARIVIAVMGITGAGKSSLIRNITRREDIVIGTSLRSETKKTIAYDFEHCGTNYTLVDTPGFNDTDKSDESVLQDVVSWLSSQYKEKRLLSGIIYLHPITQPRIQGSTMRQIKVFKALCGPSFYGNVILGTTFWGKIDDAVAKAREEELFSTPGFLGEMREFIARTARVTQDRQCCLELIEAFANKERVPMMIQKDMDKIDASLATSDAGKLLFADEESVRLEYEQKLKEERDAMRRMEEKNEEAVRQKEAQRKREVDERLRRDREERERIQEQRNREEQERKERIWKAESKTRQMREEADRMKVQKIERDEEAKRRAEKLEKETEKKKEAERKQKEKEQEQKRLMLITRSRMSLHPRGGNGIFDNYKRCLQPEHNGNGPWVKYGSWKCNQENCKTIVCEACFNRGGKIAHRAVCRFQNLPFYLTASNTSSTTRTSSTPRTFGTLTTSTTRVTPWSITDFTTSGSPQRTPRKFGAS